MAKGTFGEHLKREREMRGVSLEEIAAATRISTRFLEALENEQWGRLPGGVFNRGFVRAVARFLGLDEESLVAEYVLSTNDQPAVAVWADRPAAKTRRHPNARVAVLLLLAAIAAGGLAYQRNKSLLEAWLKPLPPAPAPAPLPPPAPIVTQGTETTRASPDAAPANLPETLELKIEAGKTTNLTVIADGHAVFDGKINAKEQKSFQANEKFEVTARNSSAVLLELNGQTVPPLGPPGEPGNITLTREDLKKPQGGRN